MKRPSSDKILYSEQTKPRKVEMESDTPEERTLFDMDSLYACLKENNTWYLAEQVNNYTALG
jgi:hypothetical protein